MSGNLVFPWVWCLALIFFLILAIFPSVMVLMPVPFGISLPYQLVPIFYGSLLHAQ